MKSMTGFAYLKKEIAPLTGCGADGEKQSTQIIIEIKSYNNRFLDIYCNLGASFSMLENNIRDMLSARCLRGKIELSIRACKQDAALKINVNAAVLSSYLEAIKNIYRQLQRDNSVDGDLHITNDLSLSTFLNLDEVLETEKTDLDQSEAWNLIEAALHEVLEDFDAQRLREGEHTKQNILLHLESLENSLRLITAHLPAIENNIKENLKKRFAELCADKIDENRMYSEIAVLLMKCTVAEEVSRLSAHFSEFNTEILKDGSVGKKLDFLCQEINREINTIGAKTPLIEISREVVSMKDALENIREQLRNVE